MMRICRATDAGDSWMKKKYLVYLAGGCVLGFCYPILRGMVRSDALAVALAVLYVVALRLLVLFWLERRH